MAAEYSGRRASSTQLLDELETLSQSLYHPPSTNRRTASLALPRNALPSIPAAADEITTAKIEEKSINKARPRRMSLSPWRSRPKTEEENQPSERSKTPHRSDARKSDDREASAEKKGIWNWKPIRALSHIGMNKLSCLFSVEVVSIQNLPASMNGLRLAVCVRKKETREGAVHTMPSRISQGYAEFEETLFLKCHIYCTSGSDRQLKFEPRPFSIYVVAVDAEELDFGKNSVELSQLIQESMEKSYEGTRIRQWDVSFNLRGKARGGELALKLGFQIMEKDGGIGIYAQGEQSMSGKSSLGRKQSKTSFSVPSPRMSGQKEAWTPSQPEAAPDHLQGMDELNLDEPAPVSSSSPSIQKSEEPPRIDDLDLPDFEVVDKGVEILEPEKEEEDDDEASQKSEEDKSASSEVVKEVVVHDPVHSTRLSELDSIAQQIKALESMMDDEESAKTEQPTETQRLDADEETVTKEFLQLLEDEDIDGYKFDQPVTEADLQLQHDESEAESHSYLSDLGKGLGCVVQTRDGGYLASMNPLDTEVARKDTPKLAMQISRPFVLQLPQPSSGCELFQKMAAIGLDELSSKLVALMPMEELMGKTAEQIAFEGIASAIIQGRTKEGATSTSTAARTVAAVKTMATAMCTGRKERILTGIWNLEEDPMTAEEILAFSMQKIESMALEALKIQADMGEEEAPFDVSPLSQKLGQKHPLACSVALDEWMKRNSSDSTSTALTLTVVVQLRDPVRRYEAVGGPVMAVVHAKGREVEGRRKDEERRYKVASLDVGGVRVSSGGRRNGSGWDTEKQRLTAMQWLVAYGMGKAVKKGKTSGGTGPDVLWSISSRVMADMWLRSLRNPDVKFTSASA